MTRSRFPWTCPSCGAHTVTRLEKDTDVDLICERCLRKFGEKCDAKRTERSAPKPWRGRPDRPAKPEV